LDQSVKEKKIRYKDWVSQNSNIASRADLYLQQPAAEVKAGRIRWTGYVTSMLGKTNM